MKKKVFAVCGVFLCSLGAFGMAPVGIAEIDSEVQLADVRYDIQASSISESEVTLNNDFFDFDDGCSSEFSKDRRRSRSEEIWHMVPGLDGRQSREFNSVRKRSMSQIVDGDRTNKSGIRGKVEQRRRSEKLSNPIENISDMLKICARQISPYLEKDFFQKVKKSDTCVDKAKVLTSEVIDYINKSENQKRNMEEEIRDLMGYIKDLESRLLIAESEEGVSVTRDRKTSNEKGANSFFCDFGADVPSFRVRKFEYVGDTDESMKVAHGKGVFSHVYGTVSIAGDFYQNCLDLSKEVGVRDPYGKMYGFMGNESFGQQAMISMDDISRISDVYNFDLSTICLKISDSDEYILFNSDFVYQGELDGRDISGQGRMFRITGEIQEGKFKEGEYLCGE